jgi:hypothetical protein
MRLAAGCLWVMCMAGMASAEEFRGWAEIANWDLVNPLHSILGRKHLDCGVMDLDHLPTELEREVAWACVDDAVKRKVAFKYATVEGEYQTRVQTVFAQARGGAQWRLRHAYDASKNRYPTSVQLCKSVRVDRDTLRVAGSGCAAGHPQLPPPESSWPFCCYEGFVESVDAMIGPQARDCGLLIADKPVADTRRRQAVECVSQALNGRDPFKFGYLPPKSDVAYIMLRSQAGELWTVRYQRSFANGHGLETQVNSVCQGIMFDPAVLIYQGYDCKLHSDGGLPTYEPHPDH